MEDTHEEATARVVAQTATATARAVFDSAQAAAMILAKENSTNQVAFGKLEANVSNLTEKILSIEQSVEKLFSKLNEIALGRPTWAVTIVIGGLSSLSVGLSVFILAHK
jgi:prophage DNA circulation protein